MEIIKAENKVYVLDENGKEIARVLFPEIKPGVVDIISTFVDDSLRGQGMAAQLMQKAYEVIKERKLKAKLTCSYAVKWFEKNPDKQDIL